MYLDKVVDKSCDNVLILVDLSNYDDAYLNYGMATNPYIDLINKLQLLIVSNLDPFVKWNKSDYIIFFEEFS